jgi:hypothetical protein
MELVSSLLNSDEVVNIITIDMVAWVHIRECGSPRGSTCALTEIICLPSWLSQKTPSRRRPRPTHSLTHTCDSLFICQLYSLPDLLEETDCKEDMPLTLPFASFVSLSQLIIVIWIKTSVGITTVFHTGISRAVAAAQKTVKALELASWLWLRCWQGKQ